jgi:hypothetical protein
MSYGLAAQMPQHCKLLRWCYERRSLLTIYDLHFVENLYYRRRAVDSWRLREPLLPEEYQRLCEIRDEIHEKLANEHAAEALAESTIVPFSADRTTPSAERDDDAEELKRIERALDIWSDAQSLRGTPAEQYLRSRGIEVLDEARQALAFHPTCPWDGATAPALIALIRDIFTDEPVGIHRTAVTADGHKIGHEALGPTSGAAIKLSPVTTTELAIAEDIETTLSAMQLGPAWAVIDADGLRKFPVLHGIKQLTLLINHDASGTGQYEGAECRERWLDAGRRVRRVMAPAVGQVFSDILREQWS